MKTALCLITLLSNSIVWAESKQVTVRGCVTKVNGDYALMQQDPATTYQLQGSKHVRVGPYLGQQVEVTGTKETTMPTTEDAINNRVGSASSVTIVIKSIKTISRECRSE
jgi:hypothetical protein